MGVPVGYIRNYLTGEIPETLALVVLAAELQLCLGLSKDTEASCPSLKPQTQKSGGGHHGILVQIL